MNHQREIGEFADELTPCVSVIFVCSEGALIRGSSVFVERCQAMLIRLREVCPQLDTDGLNNIWIIKPGAKSRGRGEARTILYCSNNEKTLVAFLFYI